MANGITSKSAKANVKARTQQRHKNLLGGKGVDAKSKVATPQPERKKVSTVQTSGIKKRAPKKRDSYGPKDKIKADSSGTKDLGVKKPKVKTLSVKKTGVQHAGKKPSQIKSKETGLKFKESRKAKRQMAKAKKLSDKADKGAKTGSITRKKYDRLNKRAQRKAERASGKRKTALGTALKAIGKGAQAVGHAYAYGHTGRLKGNKVSKKNK